MQTESKNKNNPDYARLAEALLRMRRDPKELNVGQFVAFADKSLRAGDELKDQIRDALAANDIEGLHRAVLCVATRLQSVGKETIGVMFHGSGEDSIIMKRTFARFVVTKLPPETRTKLHAMMTGEEAKNLLRFYQTCFHNEGFEQDVTTCLCHVFLGMSDEAADLGVLSSEGKEFNLGQPVDRSKLPCSIVFRHSGKNIITASQGYVPAMGRGIFSNSRIKPDKLPDVTKEHGTAFLKGFLAQRLAEGADAVEDRFKDDLQRGLKVKLPGGIILSTIEGEAFNQLAVAVTGRQDAAFGTLTKEQKTRVHMAMALLSQNMQTLTEQISLTILDKPAKEMPIHPGPSDNVDCTFSLERDAGGGLSVRMRAKREITSYDVNQEYSWSRKRETFDVRDSFTDSSLDVTISGQELDRISELDWAQCNTAELKEFLQSEDPPAKWMLDIPNKLPESYRIDFEARPACRLHIGWQAYQEEATYPHGYVRS